MIEISYRGLPMKIIQTLDWQREPLLDRSNTTYECVRYHGSMIVSYGPAAVSFTAQVPNAPVQAAGQMPAQTDVAIREYLSQPRGALKVTSLDQAGNVVVVLASPQVARTVAGAPVICDVRNGPFMKVLSIQHIQGERLWKIHLAFETFVNETPNPFVIISNRWTAHSDTNWQQLTTRVYQGICTVRGDMLRALAVGVSSQFIDDLRKSFAGFSVPPGFQRTNVKVTCTADGNSALYEVTDTEKLFNVPANCPAVRLEYADTNWVMNGSWGRAVAQFMAAQARVVPAIGVTPGFAMATQMNALAAAGANLPKRNRSCIVRAWGNQRRSRVELVQLSLAVAQARLGIPAAIDTTTSELIVTGDSNNFVQVSQTIQWDYLTTLNIPAGLGVTLGALQAFMPGVVGGPGDGTFVDAVQQNPDVTTTINGGRLSQSQLLPNVAFPNSNGTRGTYFGTLLTQVLEGFDQEPADVP